MQEIYDRLREEGDYYAGWECFGKDRIGHSGGTPNYSSRIVFSKEERIGSCVLTNLNVAASTDSLCNGLYDLARGQEPGGIVTDVWTIFDQIFTALCILGAICIVICIWSKKRGILIVLGVMSLVLASALAIVLPLIFGAGLFAILFTWAPWSLTVFFGALATSAVTAGFRWRKMGKDENNKKASEGAAAHGDH